MKDAKHVDDVERVAESRRCAGCNVSTHRDRVDDVASTCTLRGGITRRALVHYLVYDVANTSTLHDG